MMYEITVVLYYSESNIVLKLNAPCFFRLSYTNIPDLKYICAYRQFFMLHTMLQYVNVCKNLLGDFFFFFIRLLKTCFYLICYITEMLH